MTTIFFMYDVTSERVVVRSHYPIYIKSEKHQLVQAVFRLYLLLVQSIYTSIMNLHTKISQDK